MMITRTTFNLVLILFLLSGMPAVAESPLSISFVAAAFRTQNDYLLNSSLAYTSSRLRLDSYMEGVINNNGFVFIDGPSSLVRVTDGEIHYQTKLGFGSCEGHFLYERSATPSSVELVKLTGKVATVRILAPHQLKGYHDTAAPALCQEPNIGIDAVNPDGSSPPNSTIENTFTPATYVMDGPYVADNIFNHFRYAEFPINVNDPKGSYYFTFAQNSTIYANGFTGITNKMVWFGVVNVRKDRNPAAAEDAYGLKGYSPQSDSSKQPNDPPSPSGGGSTVNKGETTGWLKGDILQLIKNGLDSIRGNVQSRSGRIPTTATVRVFPRISTEEEIGGGAVIFDPDLNAVMFSSSASAPTTGAVSISAAFTKIKTGKVTKVKFPATSAVAGQPTVIDAQTAKKLFGLLRSKGAYRVTLNGSIKPLGSKAIRASRSFKLK